MRASELFARTLRDAPADEEARSAQLLIRGAFVRKLMAGVYTMLPLGLRVLRKVEAIVREEMDAAGAQEVRMPAILPSEPWKITGRWDAYAAEQLMFVLHDRHGRELGLGPTHEEVVAPLVDADFSSYKDLPVNLYQVQWKYRDEARPRSGLVRGREFLMRTPTPSTATPRACGWPTGRWWPPTATSSTDVGWITAWWRRTPG
jgi:prolyl-tRNA synthetase